MSLTIKGATSGSVDVVAPASGSDVTLTLPTTTGTVLLTNGDGSSLTGTADATKLPLTGGTLTNTLTVQNNVSSNTDPSLVLSGTSNLSQDCYLQMAECWTGLPLAMGMDNSTNTFKIARNSSGNLNSGAQFVITSTGEVGIGESTPLAKLHIKEGDSGATSISSNFDQLVLEDDLHSGMVILSGTSSDGAIYFGDSGSSSAGQIKYKHSDNSLNLATADLDRLKIDSSGRVTMPYQPCFMAYLTNTSSTQAPNQWNTVYADNERFDVGSNWLSGVFTAPVTGKYQINYSIRVNNIDTAAGYYQTVIGTSNANFISLYAMSKFTADVPYFSFTNSALVDMDANDTMNIRVYQGGGSQQSTFDGGANNCYISGYLVA